MKASTMFVICIALFIGLTAMAVAKFTGIFNQKPPETQTKGDPVMILVANSDLYEGIAIGPGDVRIRELTEAERQGNFLETNKGKLLPPNVSAANLRIPLKRILADEALRRDMFREELPDAVSLRLSRGMAAVNVSVPRERSAGGVIQLGEYVNVLLTSRIRDGDGRESIRTAQIARDCRVIMKRNSMYIQNRSDGDGPIPFTLEANPYRAALIDFAQHKGDLSLVPLYNANAVIRQATANDKDAGKDNMGMRLWTDMNSFEYSNEDVRINGLHNGDYQIGDADMARIFGIKPPPQRNLSYTREYVGIRPSGNIVFDLGQSLPGYQAPAAGPGSVNPPIDNNGPIVSDPTDPKKCVNCGQPKPKGPNTVTDVPDKK